MLWQLMIIYILRTHCLAQISDRRSWEQASNNFSPLRLLASYRLIAKLWKFHRTEAVLLHFSLLTHQDFISSIHRPIFCVHGSKKFQTLNIQTHFVSFTFLECYFCKGEINKAKRQRFMKIKQNINPLYFPTDRHNRTHNIRTTIFS